MPGKNEDNVFFIGDFDDHLEHEIIIPLTMEIENQRKLRKGHIDVYINSCGGYLHLVDHMTELFELAKGHGTIVRTIVPKIAFSAGSMLAVAGSPGHRYIGRKADHLVHYGQIMSFETTPEQIKRFTDWKSRQFSGNLAHYKKYCSIPELDQKMLDDGFFVKASQAIKYGMADNYMDKLPPEL